MIIDDKIIRLYLDGKKTESYCYDSVFYFMRVSALGVNRSLHKSV